MFLIVHASIGAALGNEVGKPALAFGLGFISHFILDMIPHGDEVIGNHFLKHRRFFVLSALFIIDFLSALSLIVIFWASGGFNNAIGAISGALGAVLPDILSGLSYVLKEKLWPKFNDFHKFIHQLLNRSVALGVGGAIQICFLLAVWIFLSAPISTAVFAKGS